MSLTEWKKAQRPYLSDEAVALETIGVDPDGRGICERTARRLRTEKRGELRSAALVSAATGFELDLWDLLDQDWLERLRELASKR